MKLKASPKDFLQSNKNEVVNNKCIYLLSFNDHHSDLLVKETKNCLKNNEAPYIYIDCSNLKLVDIFSQLAGQKFRYAIDAKKHFYKSYKNDYCYVLKNFSIPSKKLFSSFIKEFYELLDSKLVIIDKISLFDKNYNTLSHYIEPVLYPMSTLMFLSEIND